MRTLLVHLRLAFWVVLFGGSALLAADRLAFDIPAQPADSALLSFSHQAHHDVLFSFDDLHRVWSAEVKGAFSPEEAIALLLRKTGFSARQNGPEKWIVYRAPTTGAIRGRLLNGDGAPLKGVLVVIPDLRRSTLSTATGEFTLRDIPFGTHELLAGSEGLVTDRVPEVTVNDGNLVDIGDIRLAANRDPAPLDPILVRGQIDRDQLFGHSDEIAAPRTAIGNLDLPRTEDDPLPYTILTRRRLATSGVTNLNDFLQRELIESSGTTQPPEQDASSKRLFEGSTNLNLRGYGADATIVLLNGRRLPEMLSSGTGITPHPDVNFIPLSLVDHIEVLPLSAAALYTGNPVGGVINIVLRPDDDNNATELNATYTNALNDFDASQSTVSLIHSRSLLRGRLHLRLSANLSRSNPATEAELGLLHARDVAPSLDQPVYRATPNIRSSDGSPLFGPGSSSVTSVAPGANGSSGLAAFSPRQGIRNLDFFDSPGGLAVSRNSVDYPYGREQQRTTYYGSVVYDPFSWLQLGVDGVWGQIVIHRGYDVFSQDLHVAADSPLNPFGQDVQVSLNDIARNFGEHYSEARIDMRSLVLGALIRLPDSWRLALDAQYASDLSRFRGLQGVDPDRWQSLVDSGIYNPFRDTQKFGPPQEFYDRALIYNGTRGQFHNVGDYSSIDGAARLTNPNLALPTGNATVNVGADYRRTHLAKYHEEYRFGDGTFAVDPATWTGRTLQRYSFFGELQAPVLAQRWLPSSIHAVDMDTAVRYVASSHAKEAYWAPTFGLRIELPAGFGLRGSTATSTLYPTPEMHGSEVVATIVPGSGANLTHINDPVRNEGYDVQALEAVARDLRPESNLTQSFGLTFQRGLTHHFRAGLDFVDTHKTNELYALEAKDVVNLEAFFPERVLRAPLGAGDPHTVGRITNLFTGPVNVAWRHSQNWDLSFEYSWRQCFGGVLQFYDRLVYFQRYDRQLFPNLPRVDELHHPDGLTADLRFRSNFGASWTNRHYGFGVDGHYFSSRILPERERAAQGSDHIAPFCQFDAYAECDVGRWLPWKQDRYDLRLQLRVNNFAGTSFPHYANDDSGVQPYGDWRGRVYATTLSAVF